MNSFDKFLSSIKAEESIGGNWCTLDYLIGAQGFSRQEVLKAIEEEKLVPMISSDLDLFGISDEFSETTEGGCYKVKNVFGSTIIDLEDELCQN